MSLRPPERDSRHDDKLVNALERLADYGAKLRGNQNGIVRSAGFGIQDIIREELGGEELGHE